MADKSMTIKDSIYQLEKIRDKYSTTNGAEDNIASALKYIIDRFKDIENVYGESMDITTALSDKISNKYKEALAFEPFSVDKPWIDSVISDIKEMINARSQNTEREYYDRKPVVVKKRVRAIIWVLIVLALFIGIFVAIGLELEKIWAMTAATFLGVIDFTVGLVSFLVERLSDMNEKEVARCAETIAESAGTSHSDMEDTKKELEKMTTELKKMSRVTKNSIIQFGCKNKASIG